MQNDPEKFIYKVWEAKDKQMVDYYDHGRITLKENEIQIPFIVMMTQKIGLFFWVWFVLHNFRFFWFYTPLTIPSLIIFAYLMNKVSFHGQVAVNRYFDLVRRLGEILPR